jgi:hypothetical protein
VARMQIWSRTDPTPRGKHAIGYLDMGFGG